MNQAKEVLSVVRDSFLFSEDKVLKEVWYLSVRSFFRGPTVTDCAK